MLIYANILSTLSGTAKYRTIEGNNVEKTNTTVSVKNLLKLISRFIMNIQKIKESVNKPTKPLDKKAQNIENPANIR